MSVSDPNQLLINTAPEAGLWSHDLNIMKEDKNEMFFNRRKREESRRDKLT